MSGDWMFRVGALWDLLEEAFSRFFSRLGRRLDVIEAKPQAIDADIERALGDLPSLPQAATIATVRNQFYGHGAFMGAAPSLMADSKWRRILKFLMPDVYRDVEDALHGGSSATRLIPMFENNPVMAAYGSWRSTEIRNAQGISPGPHDLSGHEWDVFLDSAELFVWESATDAERGPILSRIVDRMLVAHATTTDTVQEQLGLCQYADVRKTRKTDLGGVEAPAWMDLFGRALALAVAPDTTAAILAMSSDPRVDSDEACVDGTFLRPWSMAEAARQYEAVTGRRQLPVILEVKSLRSTPELLNAVVAELNRRGIHVAAVGSFKREEIEGTSATPQRVRGETLPGPKELLFFHTIGDIQAAAEEGALPLGQHALFNGACLLEPIEGGYATDPVLVEEIGALRAEFDLKLGFYVQEGDCDAAAASALSSLSDQRGDVFELGFAWGGLLDEAAIPAGEGDHRGFGSQAMLVQVGAARTWRSAGA